MNHAIGSVLALLLALGATRAAAQPDIHLPDCRPAHVDVPLLASLLPLEVELAGWTVYVGGGLCVPGVEVAVYYIGSDRRAIIERIAIPEGLEPAAAARMLALAISERVPVDSEMTDDWEDEATAADRWWDSAPIDGAGADLASPRGPPTGREGRWLATIDARGRLARTLPRSDVPGWALGASLGFTRQFDRLWGIHLDLVLTDSHSATDNSFYVNTAMGGAFNITPYSDRYVDFSIAPRAEVGMLLVSAFNNEPMQLWLVAGAELTMNIWLSPGLGLHVAAGANGVILGGPIVETQGALQLTVLDLSPVFADIRVGVVVPL